MAGLGAAVGLWTGSHVPAPMERGRPEGWRPAEPRGSKLAQSRCWNQLQPTSAPCSHAAGARGPPKGRPPQGPSALRMGHAATPGSHGPLGGTGSSALLPWVAELPLEGLGLPPGAAMTGALPGRPCTTSNMNDESLRVAAVEGSLGARDRDSPSSWARREGGVLSLSLSSSWEGGEERRCENEEGEGRRPCWRDGGGTRRRPGRGRPGMTRWWPGWPSSDEMVARVVRAWGGREVTVVTYWGQ